MLICTVPGGRCPGPCPAATRLLLLLQVLNVEGLILTPDAHPAPGRPSLGHAVILHSLGPLGLAGPMEGAHTWSIGIVVPAGPGPVVRGGSVHAPWARDQAAAPHPAGYLLPTAAPGPVRPVVPVGSFCGPGRGPHRSPPPTLIYHGTAKADMLDGNKDGILVS